MADDYKHIAIPAQQQKQFPWLAVTLLLLLLLAAGTGTFLWMTKTKQETTNITPEPAPETTTDKQPEVEKEEEKEQLQPTEEQQFDFYTVLPQMEVPIIDARPPPEQKTPEQSKDKPSDQPAVTTSGNSYFLQIGSFQNEQAAMELRDRINTMKLKTSIQKVRLMNSGVWYRVNVGPFTRLAASDKARQVLDNHGIRYTLMKQISRNQDEH